MNKKTVTPSQLREFWNQRQNAAGNRAFSGYLSDESPPSIGQRRFDGERSDLNRWLDKTLHGKQRCLDLGCGTGEWTLEFSKRFEKVDAIDWAKSMVRSARFKAKSAGSANCSFKQGEITALKGKDRYDLIFVGGVLMYATDSMLPQIFSAVQRLLKPGGLLVLRESCRPGETLYRQKFTLRPGLLAEHKAKNNYAAIYRDFKMYEKALAAAGFKKLFYTVNRHYKFTDLAETRLTQINRLLRGSLQGNPEKAEKWARFIYATAWVSLWPAYLWGRFIHPSAWPLKNYWFVVRKS